MKVRKKPPSTKETEVSSSSAASEADGVNLQFREACERDLRSDVNRLRLYLEDQRTVGVLLDHIQDRVVDVYAGYRDLVTPSTSAQDVLSETSLREFLREVCGEQ